MKLKSNFLPSIILSPAIVTAQMNSSDVQSLDLPVLPPLEFPMPQVRRFNTIVNMAFQTVTTNFNRHDFEDRIKKYGCHCFPGSNNDADPKRRHAAIGNGQAVDAIDSVCKTLSKCHKCVDIRFPGEIDVNDGRYDPYGGNKKRLDNFDCSKNKNPARRALCECDVEFARNLAPVWDDTSHDPRFWLNNRNVRKQATLGEDIFDYEGTCFNQNAKKVANFGGSSDDTFGTTVNGGSGGLATNSDEAFKDASDPSLASTSSSPKNPRGNLALQLAIQALPPGMDQDDQCCGSEYIPYNSHVRSCCNLNGFGKVYDHNIYQCCGDGVRSYGSC